MKKFLLTIALMGAYLSSFSQTFGKFSLPHTTSKEILKEYIGEIVTVPSYENGGNIHDELRFKDFSIHARPNAKYIILNIKANSNLITITLTDRLGNKFKAKVNTNKSRNYTAMQSCESFFLSGRHEKYIKEQVNLIGQKTTNEAGDTVAKFTNIRIIEQTKKLPKLEYTVTSLLSDSSFISDSMDSIKLIVRDFGKSILNEKKDTIITCIGLWGKHYTSASFAWHQFRNHYDGSTFAGHLEYIKERTQRIGETYTHPLVKHSYQIVGLATKSNEYIIANTTTRQTKTYKQEEINVEELFRNDLSGRYVSTLSRVEKPLDPTIQYGTTTIHDDENITRYCYTDSTIELLILGDHEKFSFTLKNISESSLKVIWDEAVFVDFNGTSSKVIHSGTKFSDAEKAQPASVIIRGAKIEDVAIPTCNLKYVADEWIIKSMYPAKSWEQPGQICLMLPIQIKDVVNEYIFVFDVQYVYNHPEVLNEEAWNNITTDNSSSK